jgi:hypothetical protein
VDLSRETDLVSVPATAPAFSAFSPFYAEAPGRRVGVHQYARPSPPYGDSHRELADLSLQLSDAPGIVDRRQRSAAAPNSGKGQITLGAPFSAPPLEQMRAYLVFRAISPVVAPASRARIAAILRSRR